MTYGFATRFPGFDSLESTCDLRNMSKFLLNLKLINASLPHFDVLIPLP